MLPPLSQDLQLFRQNIFLIEVSLSQRDCIEGLLQNSNLSLQPIKDKTSEIFIFLLNEIQIWLSIRFYLYFPEILPFMSGVVEVCGDAAVGNVWSVDELEKVAPGLEEDIWGFGFELVVE